MPQLDDLLIAGWPGQPLPLPRYPRTRYRLEDGAEPRLVGELLADETAQASGETCLRLAELDLGEADTILRFANGVGAPLSDLSEWLTVEDFRTEARRVRDSVTAWRHLQREPALPAEHLAAAAFAHASGAELDAAAADYLSVTLATRLARFHPLIWVARAEAESSLARAAASDVSLFAICCLELHNHVAARAEYRVCANEPCGRLFAVEGGTRAARRNLYCSRACARAQAQREYRRRQQARPPF